MRTSRRIIEMPESVQIINLRGAVQSTEQIKMKNCTASHPVYKKCYSFELTFGFICRFIPKTIYPSDWNKLITNSSSESFIQHTASNGSETSDSSWKTESSCKGLRFDGDRFSRHNIADIVGLLLFGRIQVSLAYSSIYSGSETLLLLYGWYRCTCASWFRRCEVRARVAHTRSEKRRPVTARVIRKTRVMFLFQLYFGIVYFTF